MSFEELTALIERQSKQVFIASLQCHIQPATSKIEELTEFLDSKGLEGNEEIMQSLISESAKLIKKLRKYGVII